MSAVMHTHLSSSCRCLSSCSFCIRARRRLSASSLDASSASVVPPTLLPVGVPGDSETKTADQGGGAVWLKRGVMWNTDVFVSDMAAFLKILHYK